MKISLREEMIAMAMITSLNLPVLGQENISQDPVKGKQIEKTDDFYAIIDDMSKISYKMEVKSVKRLSDEEIIKKYPKEELTTIKKVEEILRMNDWSEKDIDGALMAKGWDVNEREYEAVLQNGDKLNEICERVRTGNFTPYQEKEIRLGALVPEIDIALVSNQNVKKETLHKNLI